MSNPTPQDWIIPALKTGLQQLLCLGLEGQPSADIIGGTLLAWHKAVTHNRMFEQGRDQPRFEEAFTTLAGRVRRWPAPADFLEALPRIEGPKKPLRLIDDAKREQAMQRIAEINSKLGIGGEGA